jgi:hypothetical protein
VPVACSDAAVTSPMRETLDSFESPIRLRWRFFLSSWWWFLVGARGASLLAKLFGFGAEGCRRLTWLDEALVSPCWASHFFLCGQEKVTKKKATPTSGFCFAKLPSLRRRSGGRREGPSLAHRSSLGIHASRPPTQRLRSASLRGARHRVVWQFLSGDRSKALRLFADKKLSDDTERPFQQAEWNPRGGERAAWMPREA